MRRSFIATMLALGVLLAAALPAMAITYGSFDGEGHPGVGAMVMERTPGVKRPVCSGTLIAPTVFLTAAHCTSYVESLGLSDIWVSFDAKFDPNSPNLKHGRMVTNPGYNQSQDDPQDIAVIILDEPVTDRPLAKLPPAGYFDQLAAKNGLKDQTFTAVGYGIQEPEPGAAGGPDHEWPQERWVSTSRFDALNPGWIRASQVAATGDSGTCNGDSGGPNFFGTSDMIAGLTITGDAQCFATNVMGRLDIPSARNFLAQFVTLP